MDLDLSFFKRGKMLLEPIHVKNSQEIFRGGRRGHVLVGVPLWGVLWGFVRGFSYGVYVRSKGVIR